MGRQVLPGRLPPRPPEREEVMKGYLVKVKMVHPSGVFRRAGMVFTREPTFLEELPPELKAELELPNTPLALERTRQKPSVEAEETSKEEPGEKPGLGKKERRNRS